jgi:hypothetical protein
MIEQVLEMGGSQPALLQESGTARPLVPVGTRKRGETPMDYPAQHHSIMKEIVTERQHRYEAEARQARLTAVLVSRRGRSIVTRLVAAVHQRIGAARLRTPASRAKRHFLLQYRASA